MASNYSGGAAAPPSTAPAPSRRLRRRRNSDRERPGDYRRDRGKNGKVGPVERRAKERLGEIGPVGGVNPRDGISRPEARKVRRAWQTERRFDPTRPRTGRDIRREAGALVDLEYGPQERELQRERDYSEGRANVMSNWFDQYQQRVAEIARTQQLALGAYNQGVEEASRRAFAQDTEALGERQAQAGASGIDPSVYAQAQQAAGARRQQGVALGGALAQMSGAQTALMTQRAIGAGQQRMEVLAEEHARTSMIDQLARDLAADRGAAETKAIGQLKDAERTYGLERQAFGLEVAETRADIADQRADNRRDARQERREAARDRLLNRKTRSDLREQRGERALDRQADMADDGRRNNSMDWDEWSQRSRPDNDGGSGGSGDFTGPQMRKNRDAFDTGLEAARGDREHGASVINQKLKKAGYPPLMRRVIVARMTRKRVPERLLRRFEERYGFKPSAKGRGRVPTVGEAIERGGAGYPG